MDACEAGSAEFTGKKVTVKNWEKAKDNRMFVVYELLSRDTNRSGLSKKDREKLWRAVRSAKVRQWRKELSKRKLSDDQATAISGLLDRIDRVGLFSALSCSTTCGNLENAIWKYRDSINPYRGSTWNIDSNNHALRTLLYDMFCFVSDREFSYPEPNTKAMAKLCVKMMRKAMRNVGLRPDATSVYEPKAETSDLPLAA